MALVEKMRISGVRSYAPNDFTVIEFQTPLTLIVGPNGSGKTTVIECLKYITTGDMPPGCKNSCFIHDPKVAGEREVKGQVKLRFKDITGKRYYCTRSMVSVQKQKKLETKSLDSVIMKEVNGERVSITSRCADMNREMITRLGVSKAILENVIFCHQEEANWPLSEGKVLKQKFDDIFAATRYIKALESIRSFRKDQVQTIKEYNIDLTHLKKDKDKAEEVADELSKSQGKVEVAKDVVRKLNDKIVPIEAQLAELDSVSDDVYQLEKKIGNFQAMLQQLQKTAFELDSNIVNKFKGTPEDLIEVHSKFEERVQKKQSELKQLEVKLKSYGNDQEKLSGQRTILLRERGKLDQEEKVHKKNIEDRDQLVIKLAGEQDIEGFSGGPFTTSQVDEFLTALKGQFQEIVENAKKVKASHQAQIDGCSEKIDRLTKSYHDHEGTIKHKKTLLKENEQKVKQITRELTNVNASAKRLQYVERELKKAEQELDEMKSGFNFSQTTEDIDTMVEEKRTLEQSLTKLREEQSKMHLQSTVQTKIDMMMKDKDSKEDSIQTILNRHEEDLAAIFPTRPPLSSLRNDLNIYLQDKKRSLRGISDQLQELNKHVASKDARKKMFQDQLRQKESTVLEYRSQLEEACGENDYNQLKSEIQENLEKYNTHLKELGAFEKIYKKYLNQLKDKNVEEKEKGCPLCKRKFQSSKQLVDLIDDLNHTLRNVPEKKQENKTAFDQQKNKLDKITALAPVKSNLDSLVTQDLPDLKKKVSDIVKEVEKMKADLFGVEESKALCEGEEKIVRDIEPDIRMIERYYYDLQDIDRNINLESSKLQGVVPGRTMNQLTAEIHENQDRVDGLGRRIEQKRKQLMESQRQMSVLERNVNEFKSQKLNITSQLQRRTQLEEQKADLSSANQAYEREIRDAEKQLEPIQRSLDEVREKRAEMERKKEKHQEETRNSLETIKQRGNKLREISSEITRYINDGKETSLQENREELTALETRMHKIQNEKDTVSKDIVEIQEDVARQQVRARELEDNIKLHRTQEEINGLQKNVSETKKELSKFGNYDSLSKERSSLQKKLDDYRKDKAAHEGRLKGHEDEIRRFQRELRHDYAGAEEKHRRKLIQVKTTEMANSDLDKYYKALDRAIMKFHGLKMTEINKIIKEYWINTYKGHDIDTIEIRADEEEGSGAAKLRRTYNYRVVMLKGDTALDMRGRCSAGQKVLASLIIRLALAETFCLNCGILALDEPTTNLDEQNVESLANGLKDIIKCRQQQRNFQLIVITHDEEFVQSLGRTEFVDYYYRVYKDHKGFSRIHRQNAAEMRE